MIDDNDYILQDISIEKGKSVSLGETRICPKCGKESKYNFWTLGAYFKTKNTNGDFQTDICENCMRRVCIGIIKEAIFCLGQTVEQGIRRED
jgi:hypothetical protein